MNAPVQDQRQEKKSPPSQGLTGLLVRYPLTSLTVIGLLFLSTFLYVSFRYAARETLTPPDITARLGLSRRLYQEGDYDQTIAINRQLDERQSRFWQAEMTTGNAYFKKGDYEMAVLHFKKAIELGPQFPQPCLNLALALFKAGRTEEARAAYRHVIERFGEEYPQLAEKASIALECMGNTTPTIQ